MRQIYQIPRTSQEIIKKRKRNVSFIDPTLPRAPKSLSFIEQKKLFDHASVPIHPEIAVDSVAYFRKSSYYHRLTLNYLFQLAHCCRVLFPSQETIARKVGCSRKKVNEIISDLVAWGCITTLYRHGYTNFYRINNWFNSVTNRYKLRYLFAAFSLHFGLLVTQRYKGKRYSIKAVSSSGSHYRGNGSQSTPVGTALKNLFPEHKGQLMKFDLEKDIPPYIRALGSVLNLTLAGEIKLCAFPEPVIQHALRRYHKMQNSVKKPFEFFFKVCTLHAQEKKIVPDWNLSRVLLMQFGLDEDAPRVKDTPLLTKSPEKGYNGNIEYHSSTQQPTHFASGPEICSRRTASQSQTDPDLLKKYTERGKAKVAKSLQNMSKEDIIRGHSLLKSWGLNPPEPDDLFKTYVRMQSQSAQEKIFNECNIMPADVQENATTGKFEADHKQLPILVTERYEEEPLDTPESLNYYDDNEKWEEVF